MVERASAQRRWIVIAAIIALLIVAGIAWAVVASSGRASTPTASPSPSESASVQPSQGASSTPVASATSAATPPPPPTTVGPPASDAPIAQEAPPVAPGEVAEQQGVEVALLQVEHVDGQAIAPGEIAGPALRLTVEVRNGTDEPVDAGLAVVNVYYGSARSPGSPLMQPGGSPFGGTIEPGGSTRGVYLFEARDVALEDTLVGVDVVPGQPTFTFRGDLRR